MSTDRSHEPTAGGPRPISIWEPREVDGGIAWVRPPVGPLGDHYATARVLRPKGEAEGPPAYRICWFGESAAAGYLYAPHLTPARVLEGQLRALDRSADRAGSFEVIDLARTNETLDTLAETVESALQLEPDLLVVYVGNNWPLLETPELSPCGRSVTGRREVAEAFSQMERRRGSTPPQAGPAGLARKRLARRATTALDRLAEIARGAGVPLLLVLPEVNLADWESRQPPVWLPGDATARWHRLFAEALAALDRGDREGAKAAEAAAWGMTALDGSTCPTAFRVLARAWRAQGKLSDARDAALAEVDAVHYPLLGFLDAPRATTDVRTLLADAARRHDLPTVDLRTVLAEHTGSPLPGRRMFLDYCHLTSEGMAVLGAAVTEQVLRLRGERDEARSPEAPPWRKLLAELPAPEITPAAEATARLGAALHGAHRLLPLGSPAEVLEHWCRQALEADPGVARAMVDLAAARLALLEGVPAVLTEGFRRLQESTYRMTLQHGLRWGNLDGAVFRAMAAALEGAGRPEARELDALLEGAAERLEEGADLARDERFLAAPLERFLPEVMELHDLPGRATLRAPWPVTAFELPATGRDPVLLQLTARLPPIPGLPEPRTGTAEVTLAGRTLGTARLVERWTRTELRIPTDALRAGLHRLAIHWPELPDLPEGTNPPLDAARARLEQGIEADLHPVFGEVFSLLLRRTATV